MKITPNPGITIVITEFVLFATHKTYISSMFGYGYLSVWTTSVWLSVIHGYFCLNLNCNISGSLLSPFAFRFFLQDINTLLSRYLPLKFDANDSGGGGGGGYIGTSFFLARWLGSTSFLRVYEFVKLVRQTAQGWVHQQIVQYIAQLHQMAEERVHQYIVQLRRQMAVHWVYQ